MADEEIECIASTTSSTSIHIETTQKPTRGITRISGLRKPKTRYATYKCTDEIMSILHVTVLDQTHDFSGGFTIIGPSLRLIVGENWAYCPSADIREREIDNSDGNDDWTVSFPVHTTPILPGVDNGYANDEVDATINTSYNTTTVAAATTIQGRYRKAMGLDPLEDASPDDYYLIVKLIDEVKNVSVARGFIKYKDLLNAGGSLRTTVVLNGTGLGKMRKQNKSILNVYCRIEEFTPSADRNNFPIPMLILLNNKNLTCGVIRSVVDGGVIEAFPTWQIRLWEVGRTFGGEYSHWNVDYHAAQQIFGPGLQSLAIRDGLRVEHSMLYNQDKAILGNCEKHLICGVMSFIDALPMSDSHLTPGMSLRFTYVILKNSYMHFSVTSKKTGQDFLSKHALHNNAGTEVCYAGEFFIDRRSERALSSGQPAWIIDNNSGTFSPAKEKLHLLKALLEFNFGNDCPIYALDRSDPALKEYFDVNQVE